MDIPVRIKVQGENAVVSAMHRVEGAIIGIFAFEKLKAFAEKSTKDFSALESASNELAAALHKQSKELVDLAQVMNKKSKFDAVDIVRGEKTLAIHKLTDEQIKKILPTMLDLPT